MRPRRCSPSAVDLRRVIGESEAIDLFVPRDRREIDEEETRQLEKDDAVVAAVADEVAAADVGAVSRLATEEEWMRSCMAKDRKRN